MQSFNIYEPQRTPESGKHSGKHKQVYSRNVHVGDTQTFRFCHTENTNTHHLMLLRQSLFLATITRGHKCAMWAKFNLFLKQVIRIVNTDFKGSRLIFFIPNFHITNKKQCGVYHREEFTHKIHLCRYMREGERAHVCACARACVCVCMCV